MKDNLVLGYAEGQKRNLVGRALKEPQYIIDRGT